MKNEIEVTGKTLDEAIAKGLEELKIEKTQAEIKILDEGRSGLFGLMGSAPARIKMSQKDGSAESSEKDGEGTSVINYPEVSKKAEEYLSKILELSGFTATVSATPSASDLILNVACEDSAILIGRQGQTMAALEYILKLILSKQESRGIRVSLNIDGYLDKKNSKIISRAKELEEEVKMNGEPVELKLPASERKIIHMTLRDSQYVETISEGDGENRRLIVRPKKV
ncbi:MAG: protein jag [Elusimicrobia bacterium]|nr:protein jag [Elusimicrobiota bacterium]